MSLAREASSWSGSLGRLGNLPAGKRGSRPWTPAWPLKGTDQLPTIYNSSCFHTCSSQTPASNSNLLYMFFLELSKKKYR